jgi:hypothetical protein
VASAYEAQSHAGKYVGDSLKRFNGRVSSSTLDPADFGLIDSDGFGKLNLRHAALLAKK